MKTPTMADSMIRSSIKLVVERSTEIQFLQANGNPTCCMTYNKKAHATESKALAMSTFYKRKDFLLACSNLAELCTNLKLS
jgi:hypothetical protein